MGDISKVFLCVVRRTSRNCQSLITKVFKKTRCLPSQVVKPHIRHVIIYLILLHGLWQLENRCLVYSQTYGDDAFYAGQKLLRAMSPRRFGKPIRRSNSNKGGTPFFDKSSDVLRQVSQAFTMISSIVVGYETCGAIAFLFPPRIPVYANTGSSLSGGPCRTRLLSRAFFQGFLRPFPDLFL